MIESVYLDWAVGLAVVFFLGGVVVSGLNEGLNWITRVRAKFLWAYLYDLFGTGPDRALPGGLLGIARLWGTSIARRLRPSSKLNERDKRPVVTDGAGGLPENDAQAWLDGLARSLDPILAKQLFGPRTAVAHVPPASLAQALVEVFADVGRVDLEETVNALLADGTTGEEIARAAAALRQQLDLGADPAALLTAYRGDRSEAHADAIADMLHPEPPNEEMRTAWRDGDVTKIVAAIVRAHPAVSERARIAHALGKLDPSSPVTKTLHRLWAACGGKVDAFRIDLERYLDADLQRLSEAYRRSIRVVMIVLASAVAVLGGIDALALSRGIWHNPDARAALVARADELASTPDEAKEGTVLQTIRERCGADKAVTSQASEPFNTKREADAALADRRDCVNDSIDELTGTNALGNALWSDSGGWAREWTTRPLGHAFGTILAALALMLGAPFWFDVIRRLTGLRKPRAGSA